MQNLHALATKKPKHRTVEIFKFKMFLKTLISVSVIVTDTDRDPYPYKI
jgi:hypothetical protein